MISLSEFGFAACYNQFLSALRLVGRGASTGSARKGGCLGLRARFLLFVLVVAIPLLVFGALSLLGMRSANRAQLDDSIGQQATLAALTFDRWVDAQSEPVRAGAVLSTQESTTPGALRNYLRYTSEAHPSWLDVRLVNAQGETVQAFPADRIPPPPALVKYLVAETNETGSWTVTTDRTSDESQPVIVIAAPADEGGAVIARIDGAAIKELFHDLRLRDGAVIGVFDAEGRILYRRQTTESPIDPATNGSPLFSTLGDRENAVVEVESPYDGVRRVYGLARAGRTHNIVIVGIPSARLYEPARHRFATYLVASSLALLAALITALFIQRSITGPIDRLARNATALGAGEISVRAETGPPSEIGRLGLAFNQMADQIAEREARLTELDRLKSEFVGSVSHELRTPLTTIKTLTHVLLNAPPGAADAREYLQTIAAECDRQIDLVANLLDLSRIEAGGHPLPIEPVDPAQVLARGISFGKAGAAARRQTLRLDAPTELPLVLAHARSLNRALGILIENAIKYTPEDGAITVRARARDGEVSLSVVDNGCGVNRADRPHLFEKFFRGRPRLENGNGTAADLEPDPPGIGLGLYVAARLVEQFEGRIECRDRDGAGTIFTILVPIVRSSPTDSRSEGGS